MLKINLSSNFFLIRDLYTKIKPGSRIMLIGSQMALQPHGLLLSYAVSKAALHALGLNLVKFFEGTGTTCNVIAPSFIETEWHANKPQFIKENICKKTAIHRFGTIEEVVNTVKFLLHNGAINGSVIEVNGGYGYKNIEN